MEEQVVVIFAGTRGYLDPLPVSAIGRFEQELLRTLRDKHGTLLETIRTHKELKPDSEKHLVEVIDKFAKAFAA
jgi:F-type H+-transporting ATPase subunit alpha